MAGSGNFDVLDQADNGSAQEPAVDAGSILAGQATTDSSRSTVHPELIRLAALTELVSLVASANTPQHACRVIARQLCDFFNCQNVFVGLCERSQPVITTVVESDKPGFEATSERMQLATAALQECLTRAEPSIWPAQDCRRRYALMAHRQIAMRLGHQTVIGVPLLDAAGRPCGACLVTNDSHDTKRDQQTVSFLKAAGPPLASALGLLQRARGNLIDRWVGSTSAVITKRKATILIVASCMATCTLLWPVTYKVRCNCDLQPVVRRYVAAPFDGRLESSRVEPGDVVSPNEVLAIIDAREIGWELSGKRAEMHRVTKELDGYVAAHESGKAEIARLELQRLRLQIEQLENQATNLEILSPIAGLVVNGDLSKSEGVPLEKGQALFEIAPLDRMVMEIAIPEDDVRFVDYGMPVKLSLDAFPLRSWWGTIDRVHPRAELKDHQNVFVAEIPIENPHGKLRPGMRGRAKISTARRPLGWNLFHKSVAAALTWFGW